MVLVPALFKTIIKIQNMKLSAVICTAMYIYDRGAVKKIIIQADVGGDSFDKKIYNFDIHEYIHILIFYGGGVGENDRKFLKFLVSKNSHLYT